MIATQMSGRNLKILRVLKGLKAGDVAMKAGIHPSTLSLIENERIRVSDKSASAIEHAIETMT